MQHKCIVKELILCFFSVFFLVSCIPGNVPGTTTVSGNNTFDGKHLLVSVNYNDQLQLGKTLILKDIEIKFKKMPGAFDIAKLGPRLEQTLEQLAAGNPADKSNPGAVLDAKRDYTMVASLFDRTKDGKTEELIMLVFIDSSIVAQDPKVLRDYLGISPADKAGKWIIEYVTATGEFRNFHY